MRKCRVPVAIIATIIGGAGLTACGGTGSTASPAASAPASGGSAAAIATAASSAPASAPATTPASSMTSAAATHAAVVQSLAPKPSPAPKSSPAEASGGKSGSGSFTVPSISSDNVVSAYGSYAKTGARVKVTICAKQTGKAFSVGAVAYAYNSAGADKNLGATILTGVGASSCVTNTFILYTAHLKVHAFIGGSAGSISETGPTLTLY